MSFWVFGYGSLLWNPGFEIADQQTATLSGYGRSFCMRSIHHRGTEDAPGLVLALDQIDGAECSGVALQVVAGQEDQTLQYLRDRELISSAYLERWVQVQLSGGPMVEALAYVINTDHGQYCGGMPLEDQAQIIAKAVGGRGPNTEYLYNTASHLSQIGLEDPELNWLSDRVRALVG